MILFEFEFRSSNISYVNLAFHESNKYYSMSITTYLTSAEVKVYTTISKKLASYLTRVTESTRSSNLLASHPMRLC